MQRTDSRDSANFFPVDKAESVILTAALAQKKIDIGDQPNLRNVFIIGVEIHNFAQVPITPDGDANITAVDFSKGFLTLAYNKKENIQALPLTTLNRPLNDGRILSINRKVIDFPKSFISFPDGIATAGNVFMTFYYRELTQEEEKEVLRGY